MGLGSNDDVLGEATYAIDPDPGWQFVCKIWPESILDQNNPERPKLSGPNKKQSPGRGNTYTIEPSWGVVDSAETKWELRVNTN